MDRRRAFGGALVALAVGLGTARHGRAMFRARIGKQVDTVLGTGAPAGAPSVTSDALESLPEPVRRWLRHAGVVGRPIPRTVRLQQDGELRIGGGRWIPFTAQEYYSTSPPAFVWTARIRMAPGVEVVGADTYVDGRGRLEMRLFGVLPVARDSGPSVDEADLLRFLNEIMWFPAAALLPEITWEPIDHGRARATMTHGGVSGSAVFVIDDEGRLTDMVADRYDRESAAVVPWSTPIWSYGEFGGVRIPTSGEAVYARPTGDHSYIRLRITGVDYDVPRRY